MPDLYRARLKHLGELEPHEVIFPGGNGNKRSDLGRFAIGREVVAGKRFLKPTRLNVRQHRQHPARLGNGVGRVRIGQDIDVVSQHFPYVQAACNIVFDRVANTQLDRTVALLDV
ncbi:hypothetical protein D3C72_1429030 [compost metagenome]